ncbi:hypothetical protein WJX77_012608 [Trebouxia sp. C0004]
MLVKLADEDVQLEVPERQICTNSAEHDWCKWAIALRQKLGEAPEPQQPLQEIGSDRNVQAKKPVPAVADHPRLRPQRAKANQQYKSGHITASSKEQEAADDSQAENPLPATTSALAVAAAAIESQSSEQPHLRSIYADAAAARHGGYAICGQCYPSD